MEPNGRAYLLFAGRHSTLSVGFVFLFLAGSATLFIGFLPEQIQRCCDRRVSPGCHPLTKMTEPFRAREHVGEVFAHHFGACKLGEESHSLICIAVSNWRAFLKIFSRASPTCIPRALLAP
jgi:hypothetical protein